MSSAMTSENKPGPLVLDRYELLERIGSGGFSTVYRARDHRMGREVAIKAVRRTDELSDRATLEARAAAKLSHPHILTVFELAEDEDEVYLVSELVQGETLAECIASGALSDRDCLDVALQVLQALEHAHGRGVVHRDIKPDNIMLTGDNPPRVKVMDFGIAQLENTQRITRQGDVVGTIAYMSPEQADGRTVDSATDIYSAALVLYECLSGSNPFQGGTAAEIIGKIQVGALPLSRVRPDLSRELSDLVDEALDPDPGLRLGLKSFAVGLDGLLPGLSPDVRATTVLRRSDKKRPSLYEEISNRFGFLASRLANGALAALVAGVALYEFDLYPAPWRLPLVLAAALAVGLLPRSGLVALAALSLAPVFNFSVALGILLGAATVVYLLIVGLLWPRTALLPALATGMGILGIGLAYPAIAGAVGRLKSGLALAVVGSISFSVFQLLTGASPLDYLALANDYDLPVKLANEYNPWVAIKAIAAPLSQQPVLLLQPVIWLVAALPAALLVRRRNLFLDLTGLVLANGLLASGYFVLPLVHPDYRLPEVAFLKTFVLCVIIQVVLLLLSPRNRLQPIFPRERT
ncbi:MAG: serine/threonine-protein kinase [Thermoleophilia bacterium]